MDNGDPGGLVESVQRPVEEAFSTRLGTVTLHLQQMEGTIAGGIILSTNSVTLTSVSYEVRT